MRRESQEKRIAAIASVVIHILVFCCLAAGGIFSFLNYHSQAQPIEVTLYHEDSADDVPKAGTHGETEMYYSPPDSMTNRNIMPAAEHNKKKNFESASGFDEKAMENTASDKTSGALSSNTSVSGSSGNGQISAANGSGTSEEGISGSGNLRPATKATLIYIPDVSTYYPESLRKKQITGTVAVRIIIGTDGTVAEAAVISSSGYAEMDDAAVQIAWQCRYDPARNENGQAVSSERNLNIPFEIN